MKRTKYVLVEYSIWLYLSACMAWLISRLFEHSTGLAVVSQYFENISLFRAIFQLFEHVSAWWLLFLVPIIPAVITVFRGVSLAAKIFGEQPKNRFWIYQTCALIAVSIVIAWVMVEVRPVDFFTNAGSTASILKGLFNPDTRMLIPILSALVETIYLALLATILAIPFAFVLSFFAAKNLMCRSPFCMAVYVIIRTLSTIFRSIEAIVWAIIFCVWVGIGPFAGMLALWIHSIAALVKLFSEQIENIDKGPVEAIIATGAGTLQVWRYGVVPQILAPYLAFTIYRWDINVRMATIVGFVGGGGIGLLLYQEQQMLNWRNVGLIMWLVALVVWVMDMFSGYIRQKLICD